MRTKGNILTENIKINDIHYEFEYGCGIKCKVIELPKKDNEGHWDWKSEEIGTGRIIHYRCTEGFSHYGPNLYDYDAYKLFNK